MGRQLTALASTLLALVLVLGVAACSDNEGQSGQAEPEQVANESIESQGQEDAEAPDPDAEPTVVQRAGPPPTPTVDPASQPLAPIESGQVTGVVIPAGAFLLDYDEAWEEQDAVATYVINGVESDELYDWFVEQMVAAGWGEPEERDGSLIFLHTSQLSARFADEELERTATVFIDSLDDLEGGTTFTLVVEAPLEE
jgi:hypothetical protein